MSKRTNGVISYDSVSDDDAVSAKQDKRVRLDNGEAEKPDIDAEWEEYQALLAQDSTSAPIDTVAEDKVDIELDADASDDEEEEEVTNTWDEDEVNVEKRLETQEARKKYLLDLRARRDQQLNNSKAADNKPAAVANHESDSDQDNDEDGDDEEEEDGWIH